MDFLIEELTMNAWPSLQTILLDGWIIRMANGYTKRANSVNPIYSYKNKLDDNIKYCEDVYRKNNLPVVFKLVECESHEIIDKKLETLNYTKIDLTSVQICENIQNKNISENLFIEHNFSKNWIKCLLDCNNINDIDTKETIESMLKNLKHKSIFVYKMDRENFVGCGYGVIEKDFVGLFDIIVKEKYRGNGYGKEIVETILSKANENGINKAYLSVVDNNTVAKNMYKKFGFTEIYKYWYRKKNL